MPFHLINGRLFEERDGAYYPVDGIQSEPVAGYGPSEIPAGSPTAQIRQVQSYDDGIDISGTVEPPGMVMAARPQRGPILPFGLPGLAGAPRLPVSSADQVRGVGSAIDGRGASPNLPMGVGGVVGRNAGPTDAMRFRRAIAAAPRRMDDVAHLRPLASSPLRAASQAGNSPAPVRKSRSEHPSDDVMAILGRSLPSRMDPALPFPVDPKFQARNPPLPAQLNPRVKRPASPAAPAPFPDDVVTE